MCAQRDSKFRKKNANRKSRFSSSKENRVGKTEETDFIYFPSVDSIISNFPRRKSLIGRRASSLIKALSSRHVIPSTCERNKQSNDAIPPLSYPRDKMSILKKNVKRERERERKREKVSGESFN